jgi:uncharacterized protein (DUF2164 family)
MWHFSLNLLKIVSPLKPLVENFEKSLTLREAEIFKKQTRQIFLHGAELLWQQGEDKFVAEMDAEIHSELSTNRLGFFFEGLQSYQGKILEMAWNKCIKENRELPRKNYRPN